MKVLRTGGLWFVAGAVCSATLPASVEAQAFGLNEIGSCAVARGFATTASPCADASTIYWNPAAATSLAGWNVTAGAAAISLKGSFRQDSTGRTFDSNAPTQWVPHVFVNYHKAASHYAWGLGFYVPYGLTSEWTDAFPGRFEAKKASLKTYYIQPNVAYQINPNWSVGGGPIYGHSTVELIQALDLSTQSTAPGVAGAPTFGQVGIATGTEFGQARLEGSGNAWGVQLGLNGHPSKDWRVGLRFMSALSFKYDGADATFTQTPTNLVVGGTLQPPLVAGTPVDSLVAPQFRAGGALTAQSATAKVAHPAQIQAGVAYTGYTNWLLEGDYAWVGWKQFNTLPITFANSALNETLIEDYNNSSAIRLGAEYTIPTDGWKLRAGFVGVASAAPPETVTPLLPEQDRNYITLGVGLPFMMHWTLDASYAHIFTSGARGRIVPRTATVNTNATAAQLNTGVFDLSANVFSFSLQARF